MQTLQHSFNPAVYNREAGQTLSRKFIAWCISQEKNRFLWLAGIITIHGCVITPVTVFFITAAGTSMFLFALAIAAITMSLVVNLAAMPTKITVPVFFLSVIIDLAVIAATIATGLSF